jgi:hypothetical protein
MGVRRRIIDMMRLHMKRFLILQVVYTIPPYFMIAFLGKPIGISDFTRGRIHIFWVTVIDGHVLYLGIYNCVIVTIPPDLVVEILDSDPSKASIICGIQ